MQKYHWSNQIIRYQIYFSQNYTILQGWGIDVLFILHFKSFKFLFLFITKCGTF